MRNDKPLLRLRHAAVGCGVETVYPMIPTYPRFGGVRWWFVCPLSVNGVECRKRVGKLYLPPRQKYFGCRHCYDLSYQSRQEYDKRIANIDFEQIKAFSQQTALLPASKLLLLVKAVDYHWRGLDRRSKRKSEPDKTEISFSLLLACESWHSS